MIRPVLQALYMLCLFFLLFRDSNPGIDLSIKQMAFELECRFLTLIHAYFAEVPMLQSMRAQVRCHASTSQDAP